MAFPNWIGSHKRLWTREHVMEQLAQAAKELPGPLPCCDSTYNRLKKGRLDWPTSHRILEYFGSMAHAWLAAGVDKKRVRMHNLTWSEKEKAYLLDHAGIDTLETIASHLRRSRGAVRRHLHEIGICARDNHGFLSAAQLSKECHCPYHRVRTALAAGQIRGHYDPVRNRWNVATYERYGIRRCQCQTKQSSRESEAVPATPFPTPTCGGSRAPCSIW